MRFLSEGRYESVSRRVGECFGWSSYVDIINHTDPDTELTLENWISIDGGQTWLCAGNCRRDRGEENYRDGKRVEQVIYHGGYNASREIDGRFYKNVALVKDPLVKTVLQVRGKSVRADFGLIGIEGRSLPIEEAHRSIAVLNNTYGFANSTSSATTSALVTTTNGSLLVACLSNYEGSAIFDSITDTLSNTWVNSVPQTDADADINIRQYYAASGSRGPGHQVTHQTTATSYPGIVLVEVMEHSAVPLDQVNTEVDASGTSHSSGPTSTTAQANELLIAAGVSTGGSTVFTGDATWNVIVNAPNSSNQQGMLCEYKNVTSADAYSWDFTTDSAQVTASFITTWKDINPGGGSGARPAYYYARKRA